MFDGSLRALPISANLIMNPNIPQGFNNSIAGVKKASTSAGAGINLDPISRVLMTSTNAVIGIILWLTGNF
jgi:hypothetical protein